MSDPTALIVLTAVKRVSGVPAVRGVVGRRKKEIRLTMVMGRNPIKNLRPPPLVGEMVRSERIREARAVAVLLIRSEGKEEAKGEGRVVM